MGVPPIDFAHRYAEAWSSQQPEAVSAMFSEGGSLVINDGEAAVGRDAISKVANEFMTAFPDLNVTCDRFEPEGEAYRWHWRMRGTNSGPGGTGRSIDIRGFEEITFDQEGLMESAMGYFDQVDYDRQLAVPGS